MSTVTIEIPLANLHNAVIAGVEQGIGYWAKVLEYVPSNAKGVYSVKVLKIQDHGGEGNPDGMVYNVTERNLVRGMQRMAEKYPRHAARILDNTSDAETGDVLIQLSVLGDIVYG